MCRRCGATSRHPRRISRRRDLGVPPPRIGGRLPIETRREGEPCVSLFHEPAAARSCHPHLLSLGYYPGMVRTIAGLAVVCIVIATTAIMLTPVHLAPHRGPGLVGQPFTHQQASAFSRPNRPFDIATIEFEQQPGIRGRATLRWHPGEYTLGPGFVTAIIQPGFRLRLQPITSRSGWRIAEQEDIIAHDLPISRRTLAGLPRPTGGLLWDDASGVLVVITGDSTSNGMFLERTDVSFIAVGERSLGSANTSPRDGFRQVTSFRLPEFVEHRVGIGGIRRTSNEIQIDLVPWAAKNTAGRAPLLRARLTPDLKKLITFDAIGTMP